MLRHRYRLVIHDQRNTLLQNVLKARFVESNLILLEALKTTSLHNCASLFFQKLLVDSHWKKHHQHYVVVPPDQSPDDVMVDPYLIAILAKAGIHE